MMLIHGPIEINGEWIQAPGSAGAPAIVPPEWSGFGTDYVKLLPPPLAVDERFRALAANLNDWPMLDADVVRTLAHIEQADALQLQHYAEWFSLSDEPAWSYAIDLQARRSLAAGAVLLHRLKGTPWAVRRVLELIGMGPDTRLIEGGIQRRYDGTVAADGSRNYSGAAWAEYSIEADLGETAGLDAGTGGRIREVLSGIAPARCHLADVTYCAHVTDTAASAEATAMTVDGIFSDMPARPRYDGAWRHDAGLENVYDGSVHASGSATYQGWRVTSNPNRYGAEDSVLHADAAMALSDKVGVFHLYNGTRRADGTIDHGASVPECIDETMIISRTQFLRYNGSKRHSGAVHASGDVTTQLEAA